MDSFLTCMHPEHSRLTLSAKLEFSLCNPFSSVLCPMNSSHYDLPRFSAHSLQLRESTVGVEKVYLYPSKFFDWSNNQTDIRQRKTNKNLTACNATRPKSVCRMLPKANTLNVGVWSKERLIDRENGRLNSQILLKKIQSSGFFYVKERGNRRDKR